METLECKSLFKPDETRTFGHGKLDLVKMDAGVVGRITLDPGWRWSNDVKPIAQTEWCEAEHFNYVISGRLHIKMENGEEFEMGPGDVAYIPPRHDAWVVGDEPMIGLDWTGATYYAKAGRTISEQMRKAA